MGCAVIFARSRTRPAFIATLCFALAGGLVAVGVALSAVRLLPLSALAIICGLVALFTGARGAARLRGWPRCRLGFFRDLLLVVLQERELRLRWDELEVVTLAEQSEWAAMTWPQIRITDRLTLRLRDGRGYRFRPAATGLDPVACRDLVLRLRDEEELRARLPTFDPHLDFSKHRVRAGELIRPEL